MLVSKSRRGRPSDDAPFRFPTPEGVKWKDVTIEIVSDDSARIIVGGVDKRFTALDMGFRDRRKGDMPTKQWELLTLLATNNGVLSWSSQKTHPDAKKQIQMLRRDLQNLFGINDSPISRYSKKLGYVTQFQVADKRGQI
jgi:hypothetical protein